MRLDKLLANKAIGSRKEVHGFIKKGLVTVNGQVAQKKDLDIDLERDRVCFKGQPISNQQHYYIKFHKPAGYVTAVEDRLDPVVMDLLPAEFLTIGVFPVGRLDKDTEGLLLLTNDGVWAHSIIHGKKHVPKTYEVHYKGHLSAEGLSRIEEGMVLGDGSHCKPARLEGLEEGQDIGSCYLTIEEGKFHQVKRMIGAAGGEVTYLKRLCIDRINLSGIEEAGQWMELEPDQVEQFRK